jgi:hypothetical protein
MSNTNIEENITIMNEPVFNSGKKAAYVNLQTNLVENLIMVNSLEDPVPEGYKLVEIPLIELDYSNEEQELYDMLLTVDPDFILPEKQKQELSISINETKWTEELGFHEE